MSGLTVLILNCLTLCSGMCAQHIPWRAFEALTKAQEKVEFVLEVVGPDADVAQLPSKKIEQIIWTAWAAYMAHGTEPGTLQSCVKECFSVAGSCGRAVNATLRTTLALAAVDPADIPDEVLASRCNKACHV